MYDAHRIDSARKLLTCRRVSAGLSGLLGISPAYPLDYTYFSVTACHCQLTHDLASCNDLYAALETDPLPGHGSIHHA